MTYNLVWISYCQLRESCSLSLLAYPYNLVWISYCQIITSTLKPQSSGETLPCPRWPPSSPPLSCHRFRLQLRRERPRRLHPHRLASLPPPEPPSMPTGFGEERGGEAGETGHWTYPTPARSSSPTPARSCRNPSCGRGHRLSVGALGSGCGARASSPERHPQSQATET
jgi:hypothetical protein